MASWFLVGVRDESLVPERDEPVGTSVGPTPARIGAAIEPRSAAPAPIAKKRGDAFAHGWVRAPAVKCRVGEPERGRPSESA